MLHLCRVGVGLATYTKNLAFSRTLLIVSSWHLVFVAIPILVECNIVIDLFVLHLQLSVTKIKRERNKGKTTWVTWKRTWHVDIMICTNTIWIEKIQFEL